MENNPTNKVYNYPHIGKVALNRKGNHGPQKEKDTIAY